MCVFALAYGTNFTCTVSPMHVFAFPIGGKYGTLLRIGQLISQAFAIIYPGGPPGPNRGLVSVVDILLSFGP